MSWSHSDDSLLILIGHTCFCVYGALSTATCSLRRRAKMHHTFAPTQIAKRPGVNSSFARVLLSNTPGFTALVCCQNWYVCFALEPSFQSVKLKKLAPQVFSIFALLVCLQLLSLLCFTWFCLVLRSCPAVSFMALLLDNVSRWELTALHKLKRLSVVCLPLSLSLHPSSTLSIISSSSA